MDKFSDIMEIVGDVMETVGDVVEMVGGVKDLKKMKLKDLKKMAKEHGLKKFSKMKKADLIEQLQVFIKEPETEEKETETEENETETETEEDLTSLSDDEEVEEDYEDYIIANLQKFLDEYMEYKFLQMMRDYIEKNE